MVSGVLLLALLYAVGQLLSYWSEGKESSDLAEDLIAKAVTVVTEPEDENPNTLANTTHSTEQAPISVDFETLQQENEDIIAWIYCEDTLIHYPIVQGEDNSYYLRHLPNGEYNTNGTLFLDCRNNPAFTDFNSIIYGHHMKSGAMFGTLVNYQEQSYYDEHPVMYLLTPEQDYKVELIAGYVTPSDSDTYQFPHTAEAKQAFLAYAIQNSTFVSKAFADESDAFITLSTCSYEYKNARYVVVGKLTKIGS